ncbi:MAG: amidase [Erysipelotrichaceae bacterium]|nr:amidase [Erysipelotrichaceae bacterium]
MYPKTLFELEKMLDNHECTSVDLIHYYLARINTYDNNLKLNSIAEINPNAESIALQLDLERTQGKKRSPLHGIPIVIKDNIQTRDMHTTAGTIALKDFCAPHNAPIIDELEKAGMIILAKTNLSEFANFISTDMPNGFSSNYGQTISPYHDYIDPSGSSTGSAVAVAANLSPVAIGTETNGSLTSPAEKNNLVTLKPTLNLLSAQGIIPISCQQDTPGPLTRTVKESALLMDYLQEKKIFLNACDKPVNTLSIGFLTFDDNPYDELEKKKLSEAKALFTNAGCITKDVQLSTSEIDNIMCLLYDFKHDLNNYLSTIDTNFKTLEDIINFNNEDLVHRAPYNQEILIASNATSGNLKDINYLNAKKAQDIEIKRFLDLFTTEQVDILVTIHAYEHSPIGGFPSLSVPAKALDDLNPMNIVFYAKHHEDDKLFTVANYYEQHTHYRIEPNLEREKLSVTHEGRQWYKKYRNDYDQKN